MGLVRTWTCHQHRFEWTSDARACLSIQVAAGSFSYRVEGRPTKGRSIKSFAILDYKSISKELAIFLDNGPPFKSFYSCLPSFFLHYVRIYLSKGGVSFFTWPLFEGEEISWIVDPLKTNFLTDRPVTNPSSMGDGENAWWTGLKQTLDALVDVQQRSDWFHAAGGWLEFLRSQVQPPQTCTVGRHFGDSDWWVINSEEIFYLIDSDWVVRCSCQP